jgi:hypothetical protein
MIKLFSHQYAWFLYRRNRDEYSADNDSKYTTYHYLAIVPGFILALLILVPYAAFVGQYPAPMILNVLTGIALILPTIYTLRVYKVESGVIKRAGMKIFDATDGVPFPSLAIALSPAILLLVALAILWIAASSPT